MVSARYSAVWLRLPSRAAATASTIVTLEQMSRKVSPAVKLIPRAGSPAGHQRRAAARSTP